PCAPSTASGRLSARFRNSSAVMVVDSTDPEPLGDHNSVVRRPNDSYHSGGRRPPGRGTFRGGTTMQTLSLLLLAAVPAQQPAVGQPLPKVVLVGDSIRLGYAPLVARKLDGVAGVSSPKANAGDGATLLKNLDEWV